MKRLLMVLGVTALLSLAGCQRYQTFLLYEWSEEIDSEKEVANGKEAIEESKGEEINTSMTQYVLVDKHTDRLYYICKGKLMTVDPDSDCK